MTSSKYKYDKGDGTMVSRQRMHQLRNPRYVAEYKKRYLEKFKAEHGMTPYMWNKTHPKRKSILRFFHRASKNKTD